MNPVLKKLLYKGHAPVLLLLAPEEFAKTAADFAAKALEDDVQQSW
jgi:hypothetical protein